MKRMFLTLMLSLLAVSLTAAEKETATAVRGTFKLERTCDIVNVEGKTVRNAVIQLETREGFLLPDRVKIKVRKGKKTVFRKTIRNSYLFVFPSGAVQVSQSNIRHAIIDRLKDEGTVVGIINTKEGVW